MRYELLRRIGIGGMAEVFKARAHGEEGFEKDIVLKRILPHLSVNEEFQARFVDEAKLSVQLQHANIVQVLDLGRIGSQLFIAMELVEGSDVGRILKILREKSMLFPVDQALYVIGEVLKGLQYAHHRTDSSGRPMELVHRDVSPANILVSMTGAVKLCDFGIAKAAERTAHTREGVAVGKVAYMAPEQVQSRPVDGRTDLYSAGVVLDTLLSGKHPFEGETDMGMIHRIVSGNMGLPSSARKGIPAALDRIVARAIATKPEDRYPTAGDFLDAIEDFAAEKRMRLSGRSMAAWLQEAGIEPPVGEVVDGDAVSAHRVVRPPTAATTASPPPGIDGLAAEEPVEVQELSQEEKEKLFDFEGANASPPVESFLEINSAPSLEHVVQPARADDRAPDLAAPARPNPLELADTSFVPTQGWDRRVVSVERFGRGRAIVRLSFVALLTIVVVGSALILAFRM